MSRKKTISDIDMAGKRVLMRVDFNVPLDGDRIVDDRRIVMALESMRSVIDRGGRLVLMSHLGRPKGAPDPAFSLQPVAKHLAKILERPVAFADDCIGAAADAKVAALMDGDVLLLENVRFHAAETLIDKAAKHESGKPTTSERDAIDEFAAALAKHGDVYCNNAFGTCHREHVSMYDVPKKIRPGPCVVGHLVEKELRFLGEASVEIRSGRSSRFWAGRKVERQDCGYRESVAESGFDPDRWGDGLYVSRSAGNGDRQEPLRARPARFGERAVVEGGWQDPICRPITFVLRSYATVRRTSHVCDGSIDDDLMGLDIGPKTAAAFAERAGCGEDCRVERADGRIRDAAVRSGYDGDCRFACGGDETRRDDDHWRRRFGGGGGSGGPGVGDDAYFDRRRGEPRIPGGAGVRDYRGFGRRLATPHLN